MALRRDVMRREEEPTRLETRGKKREGGGERRKRGEHVRTKTTWIPFTKLWSMMTGKRNLYLFVEVSFRLMKFKIKAKNQASIWRIQ